MRGYVANIEDKALTNNYFREVLFTAPHMQLVVMSLKPGEEIGMEVHPEVDQFLRIESGEGKAVLDGDESMLGDGSAVIVPAGVHHNVINTSHEKVMKLYTIYTPPQHPAEAVHQTKAEAEMAEMAEKEY